MPATTPAVCLTADQERDFLAACLRAAGTRDDVAAAASEQMVDAELRGYGGHGMIRLPYLIRSLQHGTANGDPQLRTLTDTPSASLIDGDRGLGAFTGRHAITLAIAKAEQCGIGVVGVRNGHYTGRIAYFAQLALDRNMVTVITGSTPPMVHAYGGSTPSLGTAPLCIAVPSDPTPIVLDMATSLAARGKIMAAQRDGRSIPSDWAIDPDGSPTTDPDAALAGALSPFGGAKGGGLSLLLHFLTGPLLGVRHHTSPDPSLFSGEAVADKGDLYLVIDPAAFGDPATFLAETRDYASELRALPAAPGTDAVRLPGDRAAALHRERLQGGIPIAAGVWQEAIDIAAGLGVDPPVEVTDPQEISKGA